MKSQCLFVLAFLVVLILSAVLSALQLAWPTNQDFKRAKTQAKAAEMLKVWSERGQTIARRNLALDWFFIAAYAAMWILAGRYLGSRAEGTLHLPATPFVVIGLTGAGCDVIENVCLWIMLHGNGSLTAPKVCAIVTPLNVALFFITALYFMAATMVVACR